jgi:hypothetical protein
MRSRVALMAGYTLTLVALVAAGHTSGATIRVTGIEAQGNRITVKGTTAFGSRTARQAARPLVADAGDAVLVRRGEIATLLGTAYGGRPPYRFAWSSPVGTIDGKTSPTALLDATGAALGEHLVRLTVTDAAGRRATDTAKLVVALPGEERLLDATHADPKPALPKRAIAAFPFVVDPTVGRLEVSLAWAGLTNDYNLRVLDPRGREAAASTAGPGTPEAATVLDPAPGTWKVVVDRRLSTGDEVHASVTGVPKASETLLDEKRADPTPGVTGLASLEFFVTVPPGMEFIDVAVSWERSVNDYDLYVYDPKGEQVTSSANSAGVPERVSVRSPVPGKWRILLDKFTTVGDTVHVVVKGLPAPVDPRPTVEVGGPYRFAIGAPQRLVARVAGGTPPLRVGWDTDEDGRVDLTGAEVTARLPEGRHMVTARVVDARGFERRQTTSVLVATKQRLALDTAAVTVIGIADTGINPYHLEFAASTYPDPDVLALTKNFTRHPSEYIAGYPKDAEALPITIGKGYFPPEDRKIWDRNTVIQPGKLYWIPGTKIIGAIDAGGPAESDEGPHAILDDEGHGTGSASVAVGNRYGYCPTCLLLIVEGLNVGVKEAFPWVDISSNSFGPVFGLPTGLLGAASDAFGPDQASKKAVERGQVVLFAAGNGILNFFDVPQVGYGESYTGMPWNISVGALRRDNQRAVFGDAIPQHLSSWGDGNLPSACRTGVVSQCAFGGTSAATPYTAGVFGTVLSEVRRALGDVRAGQKPNQVVAEGVPVAESPFLADGKLTRQELQDAVLKTAEPLNQDNRIPDPYVHPVWVPYAPMIDVLFEGYGAATPESARRAVDVLLGRAPMPDRSFEDAFFEVDQAIKQALYGSFDRDGDGKEDSAAIPGFRITRRDVTSFVRAMATIRRGLEAAARARAAEARVREAGAVAAAGADRPALTFYLHRLFSDPEVKPTTEMPGLLPPIPPIGVFVPNTTQVRCLEPLNVFFMTPENSPGDLDPCFNSRVSSVIANFRPLAIWPSTEPLGAPLPAGSRVTVELYIAGETPSLVRPTGVLVATDREIGTGAGPILPVLPSGLNGSLCDALGSACWTRYVWSFETTRPAFTGEEITFQVQLVGARSWAFGYEGDHASRIQIEPAPMPPTGLDFGVTIAPGGGAAAGQRAVVGGRVTFPDLGRDPTGAGDHPVVRSVQVSVDDPSFADPVEAAVDAQAGTWRADLGDRLGPGLHAVFARAAIDRTYSPVAVGFLDVAGDAAVQWQATAPSEAPSPRGWRNAEGVGSWSFSFTAAGPRVVHIRVLSAGVEVARTSLRVAGSGALPATGVATPWPGLWALAAGIAAAIWRRRAAAR